MQYDDLFVETIKNLVQENKKLFQRIHYLNLKEAK